MSKFSKPAVAAVVCALVALAVSACGSSSPSTTGVTVNGLKQYGPGLTAPTTGSGSKISGGTVYFSEAADSPPNYIFPMYAPQYCGINNIDELNFLLYRPLYWYGNDYKPTVDYNYSIGKAPAVSNGGKTYTISLNTYKWSDGETVNADDLVFWMNMLEASPATEWCGSVPGLFPFNVASYKAVNPTTFQITMKKAYNPTWMLYNELSQITPLPLAWDRTSLSQPVPTTFAGSIGSTVTGAGKVYNFLNTEGAELNTWGGPLWTVVDGPWKVQSTTSTGQVTFVPNAAYSGSPKASISKFVELPFTSDTAIFNEMKSGGPSALTVSALPAQDVPQVSSVEAEGYTDNKAASYSVNFFPLNYENPTIGHVFRQAYFRQAFQHLVDQPGWISAYLHGTAVPTYGPVPNAPPSPIVSAGSGGNPFPFSISAAKTLLTDNGWKVVPGGTDTCIKPGNGAGECGAGVKAGQAISFNLDYASGIEVLNQEMQNLQSNASQVGIKLNLTEHSFDTVYSTAVHCTSNEPKCDWTAENWGAGWIYGPDYLPTGEDLFGTGSVANYSNYSDPTEDADIAATETDPQSEFASAMAAFVKYTEDQLPVVFGPTSIGTFGASAGTIISNKLGGYEANALGWLTPEQWYLTK
jgi:peptide/nickel transport system substrate-binding protein